MPRTNRQRNLPKCRPLFPALAPAPNVSTPAKVSWQTKFLVPRAPFVRTNEAFRPFAEIAGPSAVRLALSPVPVARAFAATRRGLPWQMSCGCLADVELGYCFKRRTRQQLGMGLRKQQCIRCRLRQTRGQFDDKLFHRRLVPVPVQHQLFSAIAFSRDGGCIHCQGCPERMECWMRRHVPGRVPNHAQNGFDPIVFRPHGAGGLAGLAVAPMCIPTPPQKPQEGHRIPAMLTQRGVQRHGVPWCVPQGLCAAAHACVQGLPAPRCCKQLLGCLERNPVEPIDELLGGPGRLNGRHTRQKNVFCPNKTRDHNTPPALEFNTCGNRSIVQPRLATFSKRFSCFFRQALASTLREDSRNGAGFIDEGFIRVHGVPKSWPDGNTVQPRAASTAFVTSRPNT